MRVTIDLKIFLFSILFVFTNQIEFYVILMTYAIIHELGHLLCGLILKFIPECFDITPFGLQISFKTNLDEYNEKVHNGTKVVLKRICLAFAGPLTNIIIAIVLLIANNMFDLSKEIFFNETAIYANILIALFNLIPIYPMDGGRILKEFLHIKCGLKKAYCYTNKVSNVIMILLLAISSIAILYIHNWGIILILIYLGYMVIKQNKIYEIRQRVYEIVK